VSSRQPGTQATAGFILLPVVLLLSVVAASAWLANREFGLNADMADGSTDRDKASLAAEAGLQRAIVTMHSKGCAGTYPVPIFGPVNDTAFDGASYYASAWPLNGSPVDITSVGSYGSTSITVTRSGVPMHQSTSYNSTLQPGAAGIDTYLGVNDSTNYGGKSNLNAVMGSSWPLVKFDLSSLPAGSHVSSATLSMYATNGSNSGNVALHRMTRDWTETGGNWATSDGSTAWTTPGGDFHPTAVATTAFAGANTWLSWDVTDLADKWLKGSLPNQGVQVRAGSGISSLVLASSDHATAAYWPKLAITFLPPCGWVPPDPVVTLAPTADVDIDFALPQLNFGTDTTLWLSQDGQDEHVLMQFDTSSIASSKTVTKATLRLYLSAIPTGPSTTAAMTLEAHSLSKSWIELQATWQKRTTANNWTTVGGDYNSTVAGTTNLPLGTVPGTWVEWDITALAQGWVAGTTTNNGVELLVKALSANQLVFSSREDPTNPPQLVISYH
jgi:hypothetical protein